MINADQLNAYVDGQLDATERAEVQEALDANPQLERQARSIRELKRSLADRIKPVQSEETWKRCVKRLDEIDKARKTEFLVSRYAYAMCALLFVMIVGAGLFSRLGAGNRLAANDVAMMGANLAPLTVPSKINDWLKARNTPARIPSDKITVVGAAEGTVNGRYFARLNLRDSQGEMALFIAAGVSAVDGVSRMDDGHHLTGQIGQRDNCVLWTTDQGLLMMLVGPRDPHDLRSVAVAIQSPSR